MALPQPSNTSGVLPLSVISPHYCLSYDCHLKIDKQNWALLNDGKFVATDIHGNVIFKVTAPFFTLHDRHVLCDAGASPIVTLHKKNLTLHDRWEAFRGESTRSRDFLFHVKRPSMFQQNIEFHVFLGGSTEHVPDFSVQVDCSKRSYVVHAQDSTMVAEMVHNGSFNIRVYPNIDYAFIVALIVIVVNIEDGGVIKELIREVMTEVRDVIITNSMSADWESGTDDTSN